MLSLQLAIRWPLSTTNPDLSHSCYILCRWEGPQSGTTSTKCHLMELPVTIFFLLWFEVIYCPKINKFTKYAFWFRVDFPLKNTANALFFWLLFDFITIGVSSFTEVNGTFLQQLLHCKSVMEKAARYLSQSQSRRIRNLCVLCWYLCVSVAAHGYEYVFWGFDVKICGDISKRTHQLHSPDLNIGYKSCIVYNLFNCCNAYSQWTLSLLSKLPNWWHES